MTRFLTSFFLVLACAFGAYEYGAHHSYAAPKVFYSLDEKQNDQEVISVINGARSYIYFAIYEFTKDDIADALIAAKQRGAAVEGITDRDNAGSAAEAPIVKELRAAGIFVETQIHTPGIMHIKAIVTDNQYASGSYNWTSSATTINDEVLEVGADENTREQYENILKKVLADNAETASAALVASAAASSSPIAIDYTDAKNHIGETAAVTGKVMTVYTSASGQVFFDYCTSYKKCPFSAVIFGDEAKNFSDIPSYQGATITVTGPIRSYNGTPEIIINSQSQISR